MALNAWQKVNYVLPGNPYGNGTLGGLNITSNTPLSTTYASISGPSGNTALTISPGTFSNGDILVIIQMRGTGVGQWEFARVLSGGGTTTLTLTKNKTYTYTDSGNSQAMATKLMMYGSVNTSGGAIWSVPEWNFNTGGLMAIAANNVFNHSSASIANYGGGGISHDGNLTGGGYKGGTNGSIATLGEQGEGTAGLGVSNSQQNGNGGGGGDDASNPGGGGSNGSLGGSGGAQGVRGDLSGNEELTNITPGGGGGQGGDRYGTLGGAGGSGGGIVMIFGKRIILSGVINVYGGQGYSWGGGDRGAGGGGAGGSLLLCGNYIDIGEDKINTAGGAVVTGGLEGGKGRIAAHYGSTLLGSVSNSYYGTYYTERDMSLISTSSALLGIL